MKNDVQKQKPVFEIPINKVGIRRLKYPISVLDKNNDHQNTVADVSMFVDLPKNLRGTHMSRFVEVLNQYRGEITYKELKPILEKVCETFNSDCAHLEMTFPYFIEKEAPVSKSKGYLEYQATFEGSLRNGDFEFILGVRVPVNTLCPCSKELSRFNAHNQRGYITIKTISKGFIWLEELIEAAESASSSPVYSVLKREDEKYVTEHAYENPRFVEDIVRMVSEALNNDERITWFSVEAENVESIHNHSAYALIENSKNNLKK
ncbi:GTP cyclohydrolase I FolE2 [bacterium]|nr:GTP cyclohydrolase I FolE2 [bacterium]